MELATASILEDYILKLVEKIPGYYALNVEINQQMRAWVRNTVVGDIRDAESNTNEEDSDATNAIGFHHKYLRFLKK